MTPRVKPRAVAPPASRGAWDEALLRANAQALADLSACDGAEVVFARSPRAADGAIFLDALEGEARAGA
jgi:hypothetical protein